MSLPVVSSPSDFQKSFETSARGSTALGVYVQDQTTEALQVPFLSFRGNFTIAVDTVVETYTFEASPGHSIAVGEVIELANTVTFMQARVLNVATNTITVDTLINHVYVTSETVGVRSTDDMRVNGSVTPVIFSIKPEPGQIGDFTKIVFQLQSGTEMDFSTFGDQTALTRGCLLRVKREDGNYRNILNFKSNGALLNAATHHEFLNPKGGNTVHGLDVALIFSGQENYGVVIRVEGDRNEEIQLVIQDNLSTGHNLFRAVGQGHEVQF